MVVVIIIIRFEQFTLCFIGYAAGNLGSEHLIAFSLKSIRPKEW